MSAIVQWLVHSLVLPFLGTGMRIDLFQPCGHCCVFQTCWHNECKTVHLGWPCTAWLIASLSYARPFTMTRRWSMYLVTQSCLTPYDPMDCSPAGSSVHGDSPGKNTGVGCHFLLQRIFPAQGLNLYLLCYRWSLYHWATNGVDMVMIWQIRRKYQNTISVVFALWNSVPLKTLS